MFQSRSWSGRLGCQSLSGPHALLAAIALPHSSQGLSWEHMVNLRAKGLFEECAQRSKNSARRPTNCSPLMLRGPAPRKSWMSWASTMFCSLSSALTRHGSPPVWHEMCCRAAGHSLGALLLPLRCLVALMPLDISIAVFNSGFSQA